MKSVLAISRRRPTIKKILLEVIITLFILLFVYTAGSKLLGHEKFYVQLSQSPLLAEVAKTTSWFVPFIEILTAALLGISRFRLAGLYAAFALMVSFTIYIITILYFSQDIPCSCGGVLESMGWEEHLVFNLAFLVLSLIGIRMYRKQIKDIPFAQRNRGSRNP